MSTLEHHLEADGHYRAGRERQRRLRLERHDSLNSAVPVLGAMAGLGTEPFLLYKMIGFDVLHVRLTSLFVFILFGEGVAGGARADRGQHL